LTEVWTYNDGLRRRVTANLAAHEAREIDVGDQRHAAVAVILVDSDAVRDGHDDAPELGDAFRALGLDPAEGWDGSVAGTAGGASFVLTRRASRIASHPGQWALPGGRLDHGEDVLGAALREAHEEIGLELGREAYLGRLDDYPTRSGYVISPVVLWGGGDPELVGAPGEVASVHRIRLGELQRADSPRFVTIPESDRPVVQIPIGRDLIHAPTGAVLLQFRRVALEGVSERVHDLEQPVFAWR
jgi:8-oxo-dGTP pyrophosphatase MutT (NUDIX family)